MGTSRIRVRGGLGFAFLFWILCVTVIFIPFAVLMLLDNIELEINESS